MVEIPDSLSAVGGPATRLLAAQEAAVANAYEQGRWRGSVETRLTGHDREFGEIRGSLGGLVTTVDKLAGAQAELHDTVNQSLAVSQAIKQHQESAEKAAADGAQRRFSAKSLAFTGIMALCGMAASVAAVVGLLVK